MKNVVRSQFQTKVVVNDDRISVEGEGAPNVVGLFKGSSEDICSMNSYGCNLPDLPVILLQQVCLYSYDTPVISVNLDFKIVSLQIEFAVLTGGDAPTDSLMSLVIPYH